MKDVADARAVNDDLYLTSQLMQPAAIPSWYIEVAG